MPIKGRALKLPDDLVNRLGDLAGVPSRAAGRVSERLNELLDREFDEEQSPDGQAWEPLAESTVRRKRGDRRILQRTETMRADIRVRPAPGAGVEIDAPHPASYHQIGTSEMPARKLLPEGGELPADWQEAIDEEIERAFAKGGRRG